MPTMELPPSGVTVRMYRQGHGDCFLLAMPRKGGGTPVYVLIDCGFKPGSPAFLNGSPIDDVVAHLAEATGARLDLVIVTHEHQDHVNGFWRENDPYFGDFEILEAWFAWTEDPADNLANALRERHHDVLIGLATAGQRLALAAGEDDDAVRRIEAMLTLELGGDGGNLSMDAAFAAAKDPAKSKNKQAMKLVKDKAREHRGVRYLRPGGRSRLVPQSDGVRVYVLGPPRDEDALKDEDPVGTEAFPQAGGDHGLSFAAAALSEQTDGRTAPFGSRHRVSLDAALKDPGSFFASRYGASSDAASAASTASQPGAGAPLQAGEDLPDLAEVPDAAPWRRIDAEWLYSAETLALTMNAGINNTSLVLAFELPTTRKVLLFIGDAQRGNWMSWAGHRWTVGDRKVTTRDLLARTVLYKVGHHGSHNATLDGTTDDEYANLSWMARGAAAREFTAMITAVNAWALREKPNPWVHPLPSIRRALLRKSQGRVLQMDDERLRQPAGVPDEVWRDFLDRTTVDPLYFDYTVPDA